MKNPFEVVPPTVRLYLYLTAVIVGLVVAAVQAADGDVLEAIAIVVGSLVPLLAASNTPAKLSGKPRG